jgi:hypothetical protein
MQIAAALPTSSFPLIKLTMFYYCRLLLIRGFKTINKDKFQSAVKPSNEADLPKSLNP